MILPTIEAAAFREELAARGVSLYATDRGSLRYRPKSLLLPEDIEKLKGFKEEILSMLGYEEHLSSPIVPIVPLPQKADTYRDSRGDDRGDDTSASIVPPIVDAAVPDFVKAENGRRRREAEARGGRRPVG